MTDESLRKALEAATDHVPDGHFVVILAGPIYIEGSPSPNLCSIASSIGFPQSKQIINELSRSLDEGHHSDFRTVPPASPEW